MECFICESLYSKCMKLSPGQRNETLSPLAVGLDRNINLNEPKSYVSVFSIKDMNLPMIFTAIQ